MLTFSKFFKYFVSRSSLVTCLGVVRNVIKFFTAECNNSRLFNDQFSGLCGKPVVEYQTVVDLAATRDDAGSSGAARTIRCAKLQSTQHNQHIRGVFS